MNFYTLPTHTCFTFTLFFSGLTMDDSPQKSLLSKNVLQMKFMQRSALRVEKEKSEEERKRDIDDEHWVLDLPETQEAESKYIFEPSFVSVQNLRYGRLSFNGYNEEVEKLMRLHKSSEDDIISMEKEKETSVNDKEMAQRYESLVGTVAKKFSKKRARSEVNDTEDYNDEGDVKSAGLLEKKTSKNKKKFLKPVD